MNKKNRPELNEEQKAAAFCNENAVVAAGAGSGKTMVLANRFAWLITEKGYNVDEILTLTFTKKAAAQMFSRIHSLLSEIAEEKNSAKAARARRALDSFIHARIQTLDSYSSSIVKQCAPRYGISPDFKIDPERSSQIAIEESLPFLITHRHHPAIEKLYLNNRPNDIIKNIFTDTLFNYCHIDKPRDFIKDAKIQFDILYVEWKKQSDELGTILKETENLIFDDNALLPDLVPLMEKYRKGNIIIPESAEIKKYFDLLINSESCIEEAEAHPLQKTMVLLLCFLAEINGLKLNKGKRSGNQVKENIKLIRAIYGKISSLAVSCMQAGFIISIMSLLAELQNNYLNRKRAEGVLTFSDAANLARTILLEQPDIRQSEKESFKAIMIDEFQDNNELQKDLLFLLAEKPEVMNKGIPPAEDLSDGKLFFVGDEKQSIYLFRGADVSVFRRLKDEIKSSDLPLKINYRSSSALIGAFNAIFGGSNYDTCGKTPLSVMPGVFAPAGHLPLYEASYTPLEAGIEGSGKLSLCILNKTADSSADKEDKRLHADENEARFVAEKIQQLLNEKTDTGEHKYRPKDIAILFRKRSPQYFFEKHLRLLGIPYSCEDINDFFYGGPINDIMSVLRLAAHPMDSASYAEMLRSPFAGLSLPGTAVCLSIFKDSENPLPFNDESLSHLDETDRYKYLNGQKIYTLICEKAANESVSSLVSELWYKEGYRYETEWNPAASVYRELYDYLFHLAVKADSANEGLAAFTDSMRLFRDSGGRLSEIEIPLERPGAVHLITIHKSKGLEYPVVFLCCCGKSSQPDKCDDVFFSNEAGIVFSPPLPSACYSIPNIRSNFFFERAKAEEKLKRTAELRRLLYVGMTRAEKELYITGSLDIKDREHQDDFSLILKDYIEKKCEKNENPVCGDSILNNDTFFGLLLPSIVSRIPLDGLKSGSGFFSLEEIPVFTEDLVKTWEIKDLSFSNDQNGLNEYFNKVEGFYQNAQKIQTPFLQNNHITPVSLQNNDDTAEYTVSLADRDFLFSREFSGEKSEDVFEKVDSILEKFSRAGDISTEKFNSASFGTIAHICAEALLNGKDPVIPPNISGHLTSAETDILLAAGNELAYRFIESPLGKIAKEAELRESEFPFRSIVKNKAGEEIFINGTVDLFFEDAQSIHVVDFKTDNRENPAVHIMQMACYFHAVSTLFALPAKKECRAWIYFLRSGHAVEVTECCSLFDILEW